MAKVYSKKKISSYLDAVKILQNPKLDLVSNKAPTGPLQPGTVMVFGMGDDLSLAYWRDDGHHWHQNRTRSFPKGYPKLWKCYEYSLMSDGKKVDFQRHEYCDFGAKFDMEPEDTVVTNKFVVCHYTGTFNMENVVPRRTLHGNKIPDAMKQKNVRAVDFLSKGSPNKKSTNYARKDNTTPRKDNIESDSSESDHVFVRKPKKFQFRKRQHDVNTSTEDPAEQDDPIPPKRNDDDSAPRPRDAIDEVMTPARPVPKPRKPKSPVNLNQRFEEANPESILHSTVENPQTEAEETMDDEIDQISTGEITEIDDMFDESEVIEAINEVQFSSAEYLEAEIPSQDSEEVAETEITDPNSAASNDDENERVTDEDEGVPVDDLEVGESLVDQDHPVRVPTSRAVKRMMRNMIQAGISPAQAYRKALFASSSTEHGKQPGQTPRNLKQAQNIANSVKKAEVHDDIFSIFAFSFDCQDFVRKFDLCPLFLLTVGHYELLKHLLSVWDSSKQIVLNYDTRYGKGPYYLSILSFRHTMLVDDPVVGGLFTMHQYSDGEPHGEIFRHVRKTFPELNNPTTVIITDREKGIRNSIAEHLPNATQIFCWYHIEKNIRRWCEKHFGKSEAWKYTKECFDLLNCSSLDEYVTLRNSLHEAWPVSYRRYYTTYQDNDIQLSARWILEPLGLYNSHSGITNNASESINAVVGRVFDDDGASFTRSITALYFLQVHYLLDIRRAFLNEEGTWKLKNAYKRNNTYIPEHFYDIIDPSIISSVVVDGEIPENANLIEKRKLPPTRDLTTVQGLAKLLLIKNRVEHVPSMQIFIVRGLGNNKYMVDLRKMSCTCHRQGNCEHILAALKSINLEGRIALPKASAKGIGGLYRETCSKVTGKKGPSRGRIRNPIRNELQNAEDVEYLTNQISEDEDDDFVASDVITPAQVDHDYARVTDEAAESDESNSGRTPNTSMPPQKKIRTDLQELILIEDVKVLDNLPKATPTNVKLKVLNTASGDMMYLDLLSLKPNLSKEEIKAMNAYSLKRGGGRFGYKDVGWISDVVLMEFIRRTNDSQTTYIFEPWETLSLVHGLPLRKGEKEVTTVDALVPTAANLEMWKNFEIVFLPFVLNFNHYILICIQKQEKSIAVYDPVDNYALSKRSVARLKTSFNTAFSFDVNTPWKVEYPEKILLDDHQNCGIFTAFYIKCIMGNFNMLKPFNIQRFRAHMLAVITGKCELGVFGKKKNAKCYICNKKDPDPEATPENNVNWISCSRCERWAHTKCAHVDPAIASLDTFTFVCV